MLLINCEYTLCVVRINMHQLLTGLMC